MLIRRNNDKGRAIIQSPELMDKAKAPKECRSKEESERLTDWKSILVNLEVLHEGTSSFLYSAHPPKGGM